MRLRVAGDSNGAASIGADLAELATLETNDDALFSHDSGSDRSTQDSAVANALDEDQNQKPIENDDGFDLRTSEVDADTMLLTHASLAIPRRRGKLHRRDHRRLGSILRRIRDFPTEEVSELRAGTQADAKGS